ncbi:Unconventional myosin-IXa [Liparis tanakae]|uniref:Unconventional myosin-IXa n=1 Tax=Liparis tanakae TaxID=230148 RepID=A0A4Z2ENS2_9TELE|nr:Unconventional myosin-IXa [Liparis tanakae]
MSKPSEPNVKEEVLLEALTTRKTVTVGERLIVPYKLAEDQNLNPGPAALMRPGPAAPGPPVLLRHGLISAEEETTRQRPLKPPSQNERIFLPPHGGTSPRPSCPSRCHLQICFFVFSL